MKDLDFDELDRAVSSLLGDKATATSPSETDQVSASADPVVVSVASSPAKPDQPAKKQLVERRSSGRFMDVMHASSDMKSRQKPAVSRQAATVVPPVVESAPEETSMPMTPPVTEDMAPATEASDTSSIDEHTFPDPLDFHNFSMEDTALSDETYTPPVDAEAEDHALALEKVASELNEIDDIIATDEAPVSVDTPFIDGSTIEKRPLGAFSVDTTNTDASLLSTSEAPVETETEDTVDATEPPFIEAESEVMSVEATGAIFLKPEAQTPIDAEIVPEELKGDIVAVEATPAEAPSTLAGGSIQQQYTEKIQPSGDESTPVFDTTQYHQPIKHTPKEKSGWTTVVLIILFIIAGVGAGAAVYFFDPFGLM